MTSKRLRYVAFLATAGLVVGGLALRGVLAHPPDNPYDSTIFAPIEDNSGIPISLAITASGFTNPLKGKQAPGVPGRMYVVDQNGTLWAVELASGSKTVFLNVSSRLVPLGVTPDPNSFDERGFLGVAFHPGYASNGKFYTWTSEPNGAAPTPFPSTLPTGTAPNHQNVLAEWHANSPGNPAAGATFVRELMRIDWPQFNHDAGDITFGPADGKLYVPTGDGGGADDFDGDQSINPPPGVVGHSVDGNAQKLTVPFGKILRIDVDGNDSGNGKYGIPSDNPFVSTPGAVKEIWAYGLRNPYRLSFDTANGKLYAGDVGQNDIEEVDLIVKGGNYGWNLKEGTLFFVQNGINPGFASATPPPSPPTGVIDPIAQYDTHHEGHSVIAGFVYHGSAIAQLQDRYVFGEWSRLFAFPSGPDNYGRILYLQEKNPAAGSLATIKEVKNFAEVAQAIGLTDPNQPPKFFPQTLSVSGFAQDGAGEVYVLGNRTGRPFGTGGVMVKIGPKN